MTLDISDEPEVIVIDEDSPEPEPMRVDEDLGSSSSTPMPPLVQAELPATARDLVNVKFEPQERRTIALTRPIDIDRTLPARLRERQASSSEEEDDKDEWDRMLDNRKFRLEQRRESDASSSSSSSSSRRPRKAAFARAARYADEAGGGLYGGVIKRQTTERDGLYLVNLSLETLRRIDGTQGKARWRERQIPEWML